MIVQFAPIASVAEHPFEDVNVEAPEVTAMLLMVSAAVPVLVSVTDCEALALPASVAGKLSCVAESAAVGYVAGATVLGVPELPQPVRPAASRRAAKIGV